MPRGGPPAAESRVPGRLAGSRPAHARSRRPARRDSARAGAASPATWSSCGCVRTTTSIRRSHGGSRASSCDEQPVGVRPAVDEHPAAAAALDQDRVALPDVEHRDPGDAAAAASATASVDGRRRAPRRRARARLRRATRPRADALDAPARTARAGPARGAARPTRVGRRPRRRPTRGDRQDRDRRRQPDDRVHGGSSVDARERQRAPRRGRPRRSPTAATRPAGRASVATTPGSAEHRERPAGQRDDARGHRRRDQRHDDEVHGRRRRATAGRTSTQDDGSVAAWAASETPRHSASQPGSRRRHAAEPAAERRGPGEDARRSRATESWNPASPNSCGSATSSRRRRPAERGRRPPRPARSRARARTTPAITAARTTDGDAPGERDVAHDRQPTVRAHVAAGASRPRRAATHEPRRSRCSSRRSRRRGSRRRSRSRRRGRDRRVRAGR